MSINNENIENVCRRLREFRKKYKLSQQEMADAVLIRQASYSDLERGKTKTISRQTLKLFELVLKMNIDWLLKGKGNMKLDSEPLNKVSENEPDYSKPSIVISKDEYEKLKELSERFTIMIENLSKK